MLECMIIITYQMTVNFHTPYIRMLNYI